MVVCDDAEQKVEKAVVSPWSARGALAHIWSSAHYVYGGGGGGGGGFGYSYHRSCWRR